MAGAVILKNAEKYLQKPNTCIGFNICTATKKTTSKAVWQDNYATDVTGVITDNNKRRTYNIATIRRWGESQVSSFMSAFLYVLNGMDKDGLVPIFYAPELQTHVTMLKERTRVAGSLVVGGSEWQQSEKMNGTDSMGSVWGIPEYPYLYLYTPLKNTHPQHFTACRDSGFADYDIDVIQEMERQRLVTGEDMPWTYTYTFSPYLARLLKFKVCTKYKTEIHYELELDAKNRPKKRPFNYTFYLQRV